MLAFSFYLLKVIICSAVLFGYYWLVLRNKHFHSYNRFYLLAIIVLSLSLPLLKFTIWQEADQSKTPMIQALQVVNSSDQYVDNMILQASDEHVSREQAAGILFVSICVVMLTMFVSTLIKISSLKKENPVQQYEDISLIETEDNSTPFSFFKNIFWNNAIDINSLNGQRILKHELAHVQEKHSHDKLFLNIVLLIFWINPVFWLIRKELNMIHEFIADKKAVEDGDTAAFAAMILQTTYPAHRFELVNHFFYSPIKRRLAMLTKNKSKLGYFSRLLTLPLAVIVFAAFTLKTNPVTTNKLPADKKITVLIDAGHGGNDAGASGIDGSKEKDLNLQLCKLVKELNTDNNIRIILSRNTDVYQTPAEKAKMIREVKADLLISIHGASTPDNLRNVSTGMEVYVSKNNFANSETSKLFASSLIQTFKSNYGLNILPYPKQREVGIMILQAGNCPSVLIEAGYISNSKDLSYLKSKSGQEQFVKNLLAAITTYALNRPVETAMATMADTMPRNKKSNITSIETTGTLNNCKIDFDHSKNMDGLYIINGKEYDAKSLVGKTVTCKTATVYDKNDAAMIAKYGAKAANGVFIADNATIEDISGTATRVDAYKIKSDSAYYAIDASQRPNAPNLELNPTKLTRLQGLPGKETPLYVIDGQVIKEVQLSSISPESIAEINVLKNANAISKYGQEAVNGVIEINTKKGYTEPAIIRSENGNILYVGAENKLSVFSNVAARGNITLKISEGSVRFANGHYIAKVTRPGKIVLSVYSNGELVDDVVFEVKPKSAMGTKGAVSEIKIQQAKD